MIEILRDGAWQFAGAVISFLAIGVALVIYFLQRQQKEFAFGTLTRRSLLTVGEELAGRVVVSYDGAPTKNIVLVEFGFKNSGNKPILAADFDQRLTVVFASEAKVLSADVTRKSPGNLDASVVADNNNIVVEPLLLNPGDFFVVKILISVDNLQRRRTDKLHVRTDVRIVGVSKLVALNRGVRLSPDAIHNLGFNVGTCLVITAILIGIHFATGSPDASPPVKPFPLEMGLISLGLALLFALANVGEWLLGHFNNTANRYIDEQAGTARGSMEQQ